MKVYGNGVYEHRGKDSYRLTVVTGYYKLNGKNQPIKKRKTVKAGGDREARRILNRWIEELEAIPTLEDPSCLTVAQYFDCFLPDCSLKGLSAATIDGYRQIIEQRIKPKLGELLLSEISSQKLTSFYRELKQSGKEDGSPLSVGTITKTAAVIGSALNKAVNEGYLEHNPNDRAEKFTSRRGAPRKNQIVDLDLEDMKKIVVRARYCPNKGLATAISIAAYTGMRRAEVCGLRWCDIDFEKKQINIENDLLEVKKATGKTLKLDQTKTPESERSVPIFSGLESFLKQEFKRQEDEMYYFGIPFDKTTPVVRNTKGTWMRPSTLTTEFKTFVRDIGVNPQASFKSLRSGVASLLASENVPITEIQALLGHSTLTTTQKYYIKQVANAAASAGKALDKALSA